MQGRRRRRDLIGIAARADDASLAVGCDGRHALLATAGRRRAFDAGANRARGSRAAALRIDSFPALVALAGEKRDVMIKAALEADVRLVRIEDGRLELALEPAARGR